MLTERLSAPSYLFTVRLWLEESETADSELRWHGQVKHVLSGEVRYFRSPETLYKILMTMLSNDPSGVGALDSRGEEGESSDERKAKSILKGEDPEMDSVEPFEKQFSDFNTFEAVVKWFGSHGWELAGVIASDSDGPMSYYFKHAE